MSTETGRSIVFFATYAALLLYSLIWVQFEYVQRRVVSLELFYIVVVSALCYVAGRAFVVLTELVTDRWRPIWTIVDLLIISVLVRITGGIHSEAALAYIWPLATYSIQRQVRGTLLVGLASAGLYVMVTWPVVPGTDYAARLSTRLFVLVLATIVATSYALREKRRVEEVARLREQLALADYRSSLSQEMHDGIQHYLVSISARMALARKHIQDEPVRADDMLAALGLTVRQAADELRYLVRRLRSPVIQQRGFIHGVREHAEMFVGRSGIRTSVDVHGDPAALGADIEQAAFRIIQEALTNVEKHSGAETVEVRLEFQPGWLECCVRDDGSGFDPSDTRPSVDDHFGLDSMRQRAERAGGSFEIDSSGKKGTAVKVRLPTGEIPSDPSTHGRTGAAPRMGSEAGVSS